MKLQQLPRSAAASRRSRAAAARLHRLWRWLHGSFALTSLVGDGGGQRTCPLLTASNAKSFFPSHSAPVAAAGAGGCPPANILEPVRKRTDIGSLLARKKLTGVGVEVGTQAGLYTKALLEGWGDAKPSLFVQVDLWAHQAHYKDLANVGDTEQARLQVQSCQNLMSAQSAGQVAKVAQCKDYSTSCAKLFPDGSLDFVYIDARHDYKGVLEDLIAYWPKVRPGGVLAGHDYTLQDEPGTVADPARTGQDWTTNYNGTKDTTGRVVKGAVDDFFSGTAAGAPTELHQCPRQVTVVYRDDSWNSWIVGK